MSLSVTAELAVAPSALPSPDGLIEENLPVHFSPLSCPNVNWGILVTSFFISLLRLFLALPLLCLSAGFILDEGQV